MATKLVKKTGSDSGSVGPFLTINYGLTQISGGDTLEIWVGTYNEGITTIPSGSVGAPTRIVAHTGDVVTIQPSDDAHGAGGLGLCVWIDANTHYVLFDGIIFDGTNITGGVIWLSTNSLNNPHHFTFQNGTAIGGVCGGGGLIDLGAHTVVPGGTTGAHQVLNMTITGGGVPGLCGFACAEYGVYVKSPDCIVDGCTIYNTSGAFIQIYNADGDPPDRAIIRNNRLHNLTRAGSLDQVWGIILIGESAQIYDNVIYDINVGNTNSTNAGIIIGDNQDNNELWNNTIWNVTNTGLYVGTGTGNDLINNLVYAQTGSALIDNGSGTTKTTNMVSGVNPAFLDPSAGDFRILVSSPAAYAGTFLAGNPTDFYGEPFHNPPSVGAAEVWDPDPGPLIAQVGTSGSLSMATDPRNTTGATSIILHVGRYVGTTTALTVGDELSGTPTGNVWVPLTPATSVTPPLESLLFYCEAPIVGANHVFTAVTDGLDAYMSMEVMAFSGVILTGSFGAESGFAASTSVSTIQPGSLNPSPFDTTLFVTGVVFDNNSGGAVTINGGFTAISQPYAGGDNEGSGLAYLVLTSAAAQNPTWNYTNAADSPAATMAWFKMGSTPITPIVLAHFRRRR